MADPSDKNNQPRREGSDADEQPKKSSKSGESGRKKLVARRQLQQQRHGPGFMSQPPRPPPPTLDQVAGHALRAARGYLRKAGHKMLKLPLGSRILFVADKALSCVRQALRWVVPTYLTQPHDEEFEIPPSPEGLSFDEFIESILSSIHETLGMVHTSFDLQRPGNKEMADKMALYRREAEDLRPARPHTVNIIQGSSTKSAPRTQSTGQSFALWPPSTQAAGPAPTEAAGPSSAAVQQARVTPTPPESSSSSSSSASTGSITEEVVDRYYSPPRFPQGWTKTQETGGEKREKGEQDDEWKDSEAQESDEQSASVAEEAAVVFAVAPIPPPAGQGDGEPGAEAGAAGAQGRRPHRGIPKRLLFGLFGLKMA